MLKNRFAPLLLALSCPLSAAELLSLPAFPAVLPMNDDVARTAASTDGRYVIFTTKASNLIEGDDNEKCDVYLIDRQDGTVTLVSATPSGIGADDSYGPVTISDDGRYAVFFSFAHNLVPGYVPGSYDLFRKDLQSGQIQRLENLNPGSIFYDLSSTANGQQSWFVDVASNWIAGAPEETWLMMVDWASLSITRQQTEFAVAPFSEHSASRDGSCVLYFTPSDSWFARPRVRNLQTGQEQFLDTPVSGSATPDGSSYAFTLTPDCRYASFISGSSNLLGTPLPPYELYRRDLQVGTLIRVSTREPEHPDISVSMPQMSADGTKFVYSRVRNGIPGYASPYLEYADLEKSVVTEMESWSDFAFPVFLSNEGVVILNSSQATPDTLGGLLSLFATQAPNGVTTLLTVPSNAAPIMATNGASDNMYAARAASADGSVFAFNSTATNIDPADLGGDTIRDLFIKIPTEPAARKILGLANAQLDGDSYLLDISSDGNLILFSSCARNLVVGDSNNQCDLFLLDRDVNQVERINVSTEDEQSDSEPVSGNRAHVSDDGRYVVFESFATNLVSPPLVAPARRLHLRDRQTGQTRLLINASHGMSGEPILQAMAPAASLVAVYADWWSSLPGCNLAGLDLATNTLECLPRDEFGAPQNDVGALSMSYDGRWIAYQRFGADPQVFIRDRHRGRTIRYAASQFENSYRIRLTGNGRFLSITSFSGFPGRTASFDLVLENFNGPWQAVGQQPIPGFDGTYLYTSTWSAMSPLDLNGGIMDVYRVRSSGDGVFGGDWQGGFE